MHNLRGGRFDPPASELCFMDHHENQYIVSRKKVERNSWRFQFLVFFIFFLLGFIFFFNTSLASASFFEKFDYNQPGLYTQGNWQNTDKCGIISGYSFNSLTGTSTITSCQTYKILDQFYRETIIPISFKYNVSSTTGQLTFMLFATTTAGDWPFQVNIDSVGNTHNVEIYNQSQIYEVRKNVSNTGWHTFSVIFDQPMKTLNQPAIDGNATGTIPITAGTGFDIVSPYRVRQDFFLDNILIGLTSVPSTSDPDTYVDIIDLPEFDDEVQIGFEDYIAGKSKYCLIDNDCDFEYTYSYEAIDDIIQIWSDTDKNNTPDSLLATSTLRNLSILRDYYRVATSSTIQDQYFCITTDTLLDYKCGYIISWVDDTTFNNLFGEYNIQSACADMDQSASTTILYSIECSFRKVGYWLLTPRPKITQSLHNSLQDFQANFPFSVYQDIKKSFTDLTSSSTPALVIPLTWYEGSTLKNVGNVSVSSSTIATTIGQIKYDKIYGYMNTLIYFFGFVFLFWRILSLIKPNGV